MKKVLSAIILILVIGCGVEAPFDAEMTGPADLDLTLSNYTVAGAQYSFGPLIFKLLNADGDKPVPGVDIELYANGTLVDGDGNTLGTGNYFKTETSDQGTAAVFMRDGFPACGAEDLTVSTAVQAVAGGASALWTANVTISAC